jgi:hypothetical protein
LSSRAEQFGTIVEQFLSPRAIVAGIKEKSRTAFH